MKFNKISFMALAVAGMLVGCSDEAKYPYTEGAQSPGVYFASSLPATIGVESTATEAVVPVRRISTQVSSASITASGDTELFTIPSSVSFDGDQLEANVNITFDPEKLVYDRKYELTLTLADASNYGNSEYRFAIVRKAPIVTEVLHEYGASGEGATYYYEVYFGGTEDDMGVSVSYNTMEPNVKIYEFFPWGYWYEEDGSDAKSLKVYMDDSKTLPELPQIGRPAGCYACWVPLQLTGYYNESNATNVGIECLHSYFEINDEEYAGEVYGYSFFNPATGLFTLDVIYTAPDISTGAYFTDGTEYCQLPGYPDYSLDIVYEGVMTSADGRQSYAMIQATTGPDFDEVRLVNIGGDDVETAIEAVVAGTMEYETMGPSETKSFRMPIEGSGDYTAVAIGMKGNDMVRTATASYTIGTGGVVENKDWESLGQAEFVDGWIIPSFFVNKETNDPINPYDVAFYVEVKQHKETHGLYKVIGPYSQEIYPVGYLNEDPGMTDIIIDAQNPELVCVEPQYSGFDLGESYGGKVTIYDLGGYYLTKGMTKDEILEKFNSKQSPVDEWSTDDDGVITITPPMWNVTGKEGYYNNAGYPTEIWLPGTFTPEEAAARRIKRAANITLMPSLSLGKQYNFGKVVGRERVKYDMPVR